MAKLLVLIGALCVFAVSGHSHVRCKRSISIEELANTYPVVPSNSPSHQHTPAYPWPATSAYPSQIGGAYKYPTQELMSSSELPQEAAYEAPMESPITITQETVYEVPVLEGPLVSLEKTVDEEPIIEAPLLSVQEALYEAPILAAPQAPAREPIYEAPIMEYPKMAMNERFYKEPFAQGPLRMPVHPMHDAAYLHAAPMMMQEALYEAPRDTYPYPRHADYPYPAPYPLPEPYPCSARDAYLPSVDPWAKSPALYNDIFNSLAARRPDLSSFSSDLFYNNPRAAAPLAALAPAPCGKSSMVVDEITKPLIVEHFQAPVVVDCYQKPIVISHFVPPIINDYYEAPEFVEKAVELDLEPLIAAQPAPAPCLPAPALPAPLPCC